MKILLTGASGFIGSNLLSKLKNIYGAKSIIVITLKSIEDVNNIFYEKKTSKILIKGKIVCDVLIHVGAYTPKSRVGADIIDKCNSNILFTQKLLEKIDTSFCKKIINISTVDVYADDEVISEKTPINPISLYGMSKLYCEKMISVYAKDEKIDALTLRVGQVYGPGEEIYKKLLPLTFAKVIKGEEVEIWGNGEDLRSYIHVEDVTNSIIESIEKNINIDVINVVSSNAISIINLVKAVIALSNKNINIKYIPTDIGKRDLVFDNSLLKATLLPIEKDFYEGLREQYRYMVLKHEYNI